MSFKEKSAWGSIAAIVLVAWWIFPTAFRVAGSNDPGGLFAISIGGIIAIIVIEAVYHSIIAAPAGTRTDERDRHIGLKAERIASWVLGIAMFMLVGRIVLTTIRPDITEMGSLLIAVWILFALTVSECAKLLSQVIYYRVDA